MYAVFILLILVLMSACFFEPYKELADIGFFGEHQLKQRLERFGSIQGSVEGGFFLGCGSVQGSIGSEFKLQFYWELKDELLVSSLPYNKFRFILDESKRTPTIEFILEEGWIDIGEDTSRYSKYSKEKDFNALIMSPHLIAARVRISKETMEKEVYLPK